MLLYQLQPSVTELWGDCVNGADQGPAAVVERLLEAVNAHDLEAMVGCFADDYRNEETSGDVNAHTSRVVGTTAGAHTLAVDRPRQASAARRTASRGSRRLRTTRHARRAHPPAWPRRRHGRAARPASRCRPTGCRHRTATARAR